MPTTSVRPAARRVRLVAAVLGVTLLAVACDSKNADVGSVTTSPSTTASQDPVAAAQARVAEAEKGVTDAESALASAHGAFCGAAKDYVETLDRYGRVFIDRAATVGDVQTLGADLVAPRDEVVAKVGPVETAKADLAAAQQELVDAKAELATASATASSVPLSSATETTATTTSTIVQEATIERVKQAEDDLARTARGIDADTPLVEAGAAYNSAALALEIAWLNLLNEAECLSEERQSDAVAKLTAYTTALQTDLQVAGYDPGPIDGVYGPETVAAVQKLQTDSGLPVTGLVDEATARALQDKLDAVGQKQATQTTQLQTILTLTGFWDGPIDGQWTDELTQALKDFQTALGVKPTGNVDAATMAAFEKALAAVKVAVTSATTVATTSTTTVGTTSTTTVATTSTTTVVPTASTTTVSPSASATKTSAKSAPATSTS